MTEAAAILLAQSGDESGFTELYRLHHVAVLKHCQRILNNQDRAEDAAQEVFLTLWRKVSTYRGESAFSSWLWSMTRRVCLSVVREMQRDLPSASDILRAGSEESVQTVIIDAIPCRTLNAHDRACLNESFNTLPEDTRRAFTANVVHGERADAICRTVGIGSTARVFKHRRLAQRTLRAAVGR